MDYGFLEPGGFQQINKCSRRGVVSYRNARLWAREIKHFQPRHCAPESTV
jgi:hypothetical protein